MISFTGSMSCFTHLSIYHCCNNKKAKKSRISPAYIHYTVKIDKYDNNKQ